MWGVCVYAAFVMCVCLCVVYIWFVCGVYVVCVVYMWCVCGVYVVCVWCICCVFVCVCMNMVQSMVAITPLSVPISVLVFISVTTVK